MNKVLILYPKVFNCYTKFERKLSRVLSNMKDFSLVFEKDPNNFIDKYFNDHSLSNEIITTDNWEQSNITHAVVFDDDEEFVDEVLILKEKEVKIRQIKILITRVINIRTDTQYKNSKSNSKYEYIGRGSYWCNPHAMYEDGRDREEVIHLFKYAFDHDQFPNKDVSEVYKLAGKRLGCFCKPLACHGDVLADYLNSLDDKK